MQYLPKSEKSNVIVAFSRKDLKNHKGISGLKYFLIMMYLRKHVQTFGEISITLNRLLEECGYSTKSHNKSIYSDFREILKTELINKGYASCDVDLFTVNPKEMFSIQLLDNKDLFYVAKDSFVQLSITEFEKIVEIGEKINKSVLIGVYLFIKQFIMEYPTDSTISPPRISYPSKQQIKNGIGISSLATIENAISILVQHELIYVRSNLFVENTKVAGEFVPARNVYALEKEELIGDSVLLELEMKVYERKVYNREDVPGVISYLKKVKD